jgi:hypothetical protein
MNIAIEATPLKISIHIGNDTILMPGEGMHGASVAHLATMGCIKRGADERVTAALSGDAVMDHHTGLMWWNDESDRLPWEEGEQFCKNFSLGGFSDWFLASDEQMLTIVDRKLYKPCLPKIFKAHSEYVWTSTETAWSKAEGRTGSSRSFWGVNMDHGLVGSYHANYRFRVRPVRRAVPAGQ